MRELHSNLDALTRPGRTTTEQDVVSVLVRPLLKHFGYDADTMRGETNVKRKRPDIALWNDEATAKSHGKPHVYLEAKKLNADFESLGSRGKTPRRQLEEYMMAVDARQDVLGVLTDGCHWLVMRRIPKSFDTVDIGEWNIFGDDVDLDHLREAIRSGQGVDVAGIDKRGTSWRTVLEELQGDPGDGSRLLDAVIGVPSTTYSPKIAKSDAEANLAKSREWKNVSWVEGPIIAHQQASMLNVRMVVGYAEIEFLHSHHVHVLMRILASQKDAGASLAFVTRRVDKDSMECRIAVHIGGRTSIGELFDTAWPNDRIIETLSKSIGFLRRETVKVEQIDELVSNKELHHLFFSDVGGWVANKIAGRPDDERTAVLRHLLRCMFVWAMKWRIGIPEEVFETSWVKNLETSSYHDDVVRFLFHKRLNMAAKRPRHRNAVLQKAMSSVAFLNGSLFTTQPGDGSLTLDYGDYFATGEKCRPMDDIQAAWLDKQRRKR